MSIVSNRNPLSMWFLATIFKPRLEAANRAKVEWIELRNFNLKVDSEERVKTISLKRTKLTLERIARILEACSGKAAGKNLISQTITRVIK